MLRVLMRIASPSREAMVPMNTTHSPGEPEQWTVVAITRGVGAGEGREPLPHQARTPGTMHQSRGQGRGRSPLPPQAGPRARCTRAGGLPLTISGRFSWEILDEMLY
ncbi:protein of unknown function [Methanoculleus bourgensis]|uniref:Uncharacterized protein n=1 Tax=Methanoculleus bourgensis TaxID=83986 RepID=A0A0X3BKZ4_9EURY|nr:protein of unknown function [Methanoculleus bourgensis]